MATPDKFLMRLARGARALPSADDAARAYLASIRRPLRAAGEADMSLGTPLFDRMYQADAAYENLVRGRTANLRNAGGDLARIARQSILDENLAAREARDASMLTMDPDGLSRYAMPLLAGAAVAGGGGIALQNALAERQRKEQEAAAVREAAAQYANEVAASRPSLEQQYLNDIDGFDPVAADIALPQADERQIVFSEDVDTTDEDAAMLGSMAAQSAAMSQDPYPDGDPYEGPFPLRRPIAPEEDIDFHTGRVKTFEESVFPPGVTPGAALPPRSLGPSMPQRAPRRTVNPLRPQQTGMWYY